MTISFHVSFTRIRCCLFFIFQPIHFHFLLFRSWFFFICWRDISACVIRRRTRSIHTTSQQLSTGCSFQAPIQNWLHVALSAELCLALNPSALRCAICASWDCASCYNDVIRSAACKFFSKSSIMCHDSCAADHILGALRTFTAELHTPALHILKVGAYTYAHNKLLYLSHSGINHCCCWTPYH